MAPPFVISTNGNKNMYFQHVHFFFKYILYPFFDSDCYKNRMKIIVGGRYKKTKKKNISQSLIK